MSKGIKISPNYYQSDWLALDLTKDSKDWEKAIQIFQDRMEGRFLKQIEVLDKNPNRSIGLYSGFAIMSLTCLFIETLEQFLNGNITTQKITRQKYSFWQRIFGKNLNHFGSDSVAFYKFFQRSPTLAAFFDCQEKADVFYSQIRCGLLHQAQTKGRSTIHIKEGKPVLEWVDQSNLQAGLNIHRKLFLKEINSIYEQFISELKRPGNLNYRKKTLGRKMTNIARQL